MLWDISLKLGIYMACSRWCYTSSSSFIPIGTLWPTLQPKIGQSHLSAFMALKIILRPQIWYTHLYCECLDPYWFSSWLGNFWPSGRQNTWKGVLLGLPASEKFSGLFIRPFEKRDVLCRGNVRPSVRLSVRPSVRPSVRVFRTFFQHALRYQFETWYIHLVGGTTCRVWVASQLGHFDLVYSQK